VSLIKILPEYIENFSLTLHPEIDYVSSSIGSTGSMPLSPRPSKCLKNMADPSLVGESVFDPTTSSPTYNVEANRISLALDSARSIVNHAISQGVSGNVSAIMGSYMTYVNSSSQIARNTKRFEIVRFDPPFSYKINTSAKNAIRKVLMPYYATNYDNCQFSYTNYNSLNFFTSSNVPSDSAIIYPNLQDSTTGLRPLATSGAFSLDFWINPRYGNSVGKEYKAGTIMHLSSTYCVSLVSGSAVDGNGSSSTFRILLQLSHSADIAPRLVDTSKVNNSRSYPRDLAFVSKDNAMHKNHWHHVCIRWGGNTVNSGTGSISIDGDQTYFNVPSSSIDPPKGVSAGALFIGNYYDGFDAETKFFNTKAAAAEGLYPVANGFSADPQNFSLNHPLNAEIHDVKIFDKYITFDEIRKNRTTGMSSTKNLKLYVPPFFSPESITHDEIITPFQTERKKTDKPFNTTFSFGVGGCLVNLQNFVRDYASRLQPRLYNLTASTMDDNVLEITANDFVYHTGSTRKRNLTILPCDNGYFTPDYQILMSGSEKSKLEAFRDDYGGYNISTIDLSRMVSTGSAYTGLTTVTANELLSAIKDEISTLPDATSMSNIANVIAGVTPEILSSLQGATSPGQILTIYQRTRDPSSNEISIFDISNLYYGNRILPESFYLTDPNVTASQGHIRMTLADNGAGGLYRADSDSPHAKWSNVGTILYNEGIAVIKSPHIPFFGKDEFEARFKGEQNTHIMTVNIPAEAGLFNSSSNPSYKFVSASFDANESDPRFVYLSGLYLHDDNLNVIMRSNISQPVKKRSSDEMLIRFKQDF